MPSWTLCCRRCAFFILAASLCLCSHFAFSSLSCWRDGAPQKHIHDAEFSVDSASQTHTRRVWNSNRAAHHRKEKKTKPAERARRCRPNSAFHSGAGLRLVKQRRHDGLKRLLPFPPGRFESFALHAHSNRRACERRRESAKNSASSQQQQHQQQRAPRTWHVTHVVLCRADICTRPSSVTTSSTLELRAGTEGG